VPVQDLRFLAQRADLAAEGAGGAHRGVGDDQHGGTAVRNPYERTRHALRRLYAEAAVERREGVLGKTQQEWRRLR
jgi:hypothetical protein